MLCSNLVERFQNIVIATLVLVSYAPNVLTKSDNIAKNAINRSNQNAPVTEEATFTEYFIEHNVSHPDAKRSFFETGVKLIDDKPMGFCTNFKCTDQIIKYCLSHHMLDDHCCCDSRHGTEQIPWIPHSCYAEQSGRACKPFWGSCIKYTDIRECCCDRVLAKRWKLLYSSSVTTTVNAFTQLVCVFLLITSWSYN